jgi:hypothetical protein
MKIGRNAPCPCGSGKKYKKCCLDKNITPPEALNYRRLSRALNELMPELIDHGFSVFGHAVHSLAMAEFFGWPDPEELPDEKTVERMEMLFWPWFVFNWEYDSLEYEDDLPEVPEEATIAELYLESQRIDPQSPAAKLIHAANRLPYSFLEILSVQPGKSLHIKDVMTGADMIVQERAGSEMLSKGDIVYGRVVRIDDVGMFLGLSAAVLPPGIKPQLIDLRRSLSEGRRKLSNDDLYDWDLEIREFFMEIDRVLHNRPELRNTDGDPMEFHKLTYDVESADQAVEKLASLCETETTDEIRAAAAMDKGGNIARVEFNWDQIGNPIHQAMPNTVLGKIKINGKQMTVTVNSAARAKKIQKEIKKRLGAAAKLRLDVISDLDAMMNEEAGNEPMTEKELMESPEIQQHIAQMLETHWDSWVDQKIPALGNKTPKQAVRTADGREAVEALLLDAEKMTRRDPIRSSFEMDFIAGVRRQLKLDGPLRSNSRKPDGRQAVERMARIKDLIKAFGDQRLNDTYTGFSYSLCDAAAASDMLNMHRGRIEIWAAAIVYAIAQLNFLFSRETPHHLTPDELCNWFNVKKGTVSSKAASIRNTLDLFFDDERFCAPHVTSSFQFFEDENGFIFPAASLQQDGERPIEPIPLKPPPEADIPEKAAKMKQQPKKRDDRQLSLFDD